MCGSLDHVGLRDVHTHVVIDDLVPDTTRRSILSTALLIGGVDVAVTANGCLMPHRDCGSLRPLADHLPIVRRQLRIVMNQ